MRLGKLLIGFEVIKKKRIHETGTSFTGRPGAWGWQQGWQVFPSQIVPGAVSYNLHIMKMS